MVSAFPETKNQGFPELTCDAFLAYGAPGTHDARRTAPSVNGLFRGGVGGCLPLPTLLFPVRYRYGAWPENLALGSAHPAERHTLLAWQRATTISAGRARRGRILLLMADGVPIADIAALVGISRRFVYKWVQRFLDKGMEGLVNKRERGYRRVSAKPARAASHAVNA